jgi:hypothetical protein
MENQTGAVVINVPYAAGVGFGVVKFAFPVIAVLMFA